MHNPMKATAKWPPSRLPAARRRAAAEATQKETSLLSASAARALAAPSAVADQRVYLLASV